MAKAPKTLNHPTFGRCELIPSLLAIKWATPLDGKAVVSALSGFGLSLADEAPRAERRKAGASRDPVQPSVNQTTTLSWAKGARLTEATLARIEENDAVEWVAPTYQATRSDRGPQSYFAINPTCLLLTAAAATAVGDVTLIDPSASVDDRRSQLLKGFVVLNLPNGNAIELAAKIGKLADAGGILFENIPYLSPICACFCGGSHAKGAGGLDCSPSTTSHIPNDTFFPVQWGLQRINAPRAWPLSEGDPNIVIAVLDQGVELGHPDLNMWPLSYSTVTHTNDGSPVGNHGTACAGIIGARIDNSAGVSGLAGRCRIMAIATNFADTEVAEGLYFAADNGARVISMSFGVYPSWMIWNFAIIEAALQYCQDKNVVLVAATGNENQNVSRFPATDPRTIGVGGSNRDDVRKAIGDTSIENWWGACYGPDVDVVAPCLEIPTTDRLAGAGYTPTDYDMRFNGTSSATPHVAGLAGLIISVNPALTNAEVRQIMSETTDKINVASYTYLATAGKPYGTWNDQVGYGRINAERAVLVACSFGSRSKEHGPCDVDVPTPEECCVSPCDPPWRPDQQCIVWYEERFLRQPIAKRDNTAADFARSIYIEFRITYEHKLCLLGKQHGPLIYTVTLLPSEKLTLYHSDRYRRITSTQDRFSVQTTFMQFFSSIHQARVTNTVDALSERLSRVKTTSSGSFGGGLGGLLGAFHRREHF
jgi:thermitase